MKEILKRLLDRKKDLCISQGLFTKTLEDRYPSLISKDSDNDKKNLEKELECLLSSSVKFRSGRIVIRAPRISWKKKVMLTRNPGLKEPNYSYKAFDLIEIKEIDEDGNLLKAKNNWADLGKVMLGVLKKSKKIDQEKLTAFYKFLKETLVWKKDLDKLINSGYKDEKTFISIGSSRIKIHSRDFEIGILKPLGERKYERFDYLMSHEFIEYDSNGRTGISNQVMLTDFWEHFKQFDKALKEAERSKTKLIKQSKNLFERLKEYNKPFRVLNKLLK